MVTPVDFPRRTQPSADVDQERHFGTRLVGCARLPAAHRGRIDTGRPHRRPPATPPAPARAPAAPFGPAFVPAPGAAGAARTARAAARRSGLGGRAADLVGDA